jgi:eukaryotic-like serine/threonine-protein kinase
MRDSTLPTAIGRYRPAGILGTGAMGTVYKAHDPVIDRMVAIKVVRTEALDTETRAEFMGRFRLEVQAAARCAHPAIVAVYDFVDAGNPAIVMELVEGSSLDRILKVPKRRRVEVVAILSQVLGGLGYAHGKGITHRDIKPANIIVTPSGQAKIADFGIARLNGISLTDAGAMLGTPGYMAPEQVTGDLVDHRADLFAVGAILYETFAGRPPFAGRTVADTLALLSGPSPADMGPIEAAGGARLVPVMRQALAKEPARRLQSVQQFLTALQEAIATRSTAAVSATAPGAAQTVQRRWDPALLQRLERQLAQYLGPIARVTVARAASTAADPDQLYVTLANSLRSATDRSAFLCGLGGARVEPTFAGAKRLTHTAAIPVGVSQGLASVPPEATTAAQTVLAHFVGPIARMLVRDAAAQATSGTEFIDSLCSHVSKPDELSTLRRRLRTEVEPKLPR